MSRNVSDDFPSLSDKGEPSLHTCPRSGSTANKARQDVYVLYDIIQAAELSSDPPFRALFAAYDKVLQDRGIAAASDQLYFRFLLRMREDQPKAQPLFSQFRTFLSKLGITVDLGADEDAENDHTGELDIAYDQNASESHTDFTFNRPLQRRASFSSLPDASTPQPDTFRQAAEERPLVRKLSFDSASKHGGRHAARVRFVEEYSATDVTNSLLHPSHHASSTAAPFQQQRQYLPQLESYDSGLSDMNSDYTDADVDRDHGVDEEDYLRQLEINAKNLRFHHVAAHCVRIFRDWAHRSRTNRQTRRRLELVAHSRDQDTLLRQAFETWRHALKQREKAKETELFYAQLERKAEKARGYFLLTKAFTHWAQCAEDEILRKSAAKRHVLRTRYFNAWRDITVVNEMKVRRVGLSKWFKIWQRRAGVCHDQDEDAVEFNEVRIASRFYRQWFWKFCDHTAPAWRDSKLRVSYFNRWLEWTRQSAYRDEWATQYADHSKMRRAFGLWFSKLMAIREQNAAAQNFQIRRLTDAPLGDANRELQVSVILGRRAARSTIASWSDRTQMYVLAGRVNELRTMRNAWTTWNDCLRVRALQHTIDDRLAAQALYKWVLAERLALCSRVRNDKLKVWSFSQMYEKMTARQQLLDERLQFFYNRFNARRARDVLKTWSSRTIVVKDLAASATAVRNADVESRAFKKMQTQVEHNAELQRWCDDARFYVLCSTAVKKWHQSTVAVKREKRREAYTVMRRKVKTRQARELFSRWRQAAQSQAASAAVAEETYHRHLASVTADLFQKWYEYSIFLEEASDEAETFWQRSQLQLYTGFLSSKLQTIQDQNLQADAMAAELVESTASSSLRKLNWQAFQLRRLDETALSLRERNEKKHYRGMLKYWNQRAQQRRRSPSAPGDLVLDITNRSGGSGRSQRLRDLSGSTATFLVEEALAEPDIQPQPRPPAKLQPRAVPHLFARSIGPGISAPAAPAAATPGYLRTPSRRTTGKFKSRLPLTASAAATTTTSNAATLVSQSHSQPHPEPEPDLEPEPLSTPLFGRFRSSVGVAPASAGMTASMTRKDAAARRRGGLSFAQRLREVRSSPGGPDASPGPRAGR